MEEQWWRSSGEGAMVGALSMVTNDIVPFTMVVGKRPRLSGLNLVGLKRRGLSGQIINKLNSPNENALAGTSDYDELKKYGDTFNRDNNVKHIDLSL